MKRSLILIFISVLTVSVLFSCSSWDRSHNDSDDNDETGKNYVYDENDIGKSYVGDSILDLSLFTVGSDPCADIWGEHIKRRYKDVDDADMFRIINVLSDTEMTAVITSGTERGSILRCANVNYSECEFGKHLLSLIEDDSGIYLRFGENYLIGERLDSPEISFAIDKETADTLFGIFGVDP